MKNKIILSSIVALMLIITFSSQNLYASEVTGNLSSSGSNTGQGATGSLSGTVTPTSTLNGNVSGGSSGGGSGGRSIGSVLGASTTKSDTNFLSSDGVAIQTAGERFAFNSEDVVLASNQDIGEGLPNISQKASVLDASKGVSNEYWVWIILIILLAIAITLYFYKSTTIKKGSEIKKLNL